MIKIFLITLFAINDFFVPKGDLNRNSLYYNAERAVISWDLKSADKFINQLPDTDPMNYYLKGYREFFAGNYKKSLDLLTIAKEKLGSVKKVNSLYNLVKNSYKEAEDFKFVETEHFKIFYYPGKDEVLLPYTKETLEKAYNSIGKDLDFFPAEKIRAEIYPSYESFMRVSTLTRNDIETSGTIALCNYRKVMITSPKATTRGYRWRDTFSHELVHYFLTRKTRNYAPLWLQEGIAKSEEVRWRSLTQTPLDSIYQSMLVDAIRKEHFVTFHQMIPSFAKLGSSQEVTLAFAEVMSIIEKIVRDGGYKELRKLVDASVKYRGNSDLMVKVLGYNNVDDFFKKWKSYITGVNLERIPGVSLDKPEIRQKSPSNNYFRLSEMLKDQRYFKTAAFEMEEAIKRSKIKSPVMYYKYAFSLINTGDYVKAKKVIRDILPLFPYYGGLHKLLGFVLMHNKKYKKAIGEFETALAINPFDPVIHVKLKELYEQEGNKKLAERENDVLKVFMKYGGS